MRVQLLTETEPDAEQLADEYAVAAVGRAREAEGCDAMTFSLNEPPRPDGGSVVLLVFGDSDEFIEGERDRWAELQEEGAIEDWEEKPVPQEQMRRAQQAKFGEQGGQLAPTFFDLSSTMARHGFEEFGGEDGSFPAAVDEYPTEDSQYSPGMWMLFHHMAFANFGYSAVEEIDMHVEGIEEDLRIFAERHDETEVDAKIDDLIDALDEMREDVKDGRPRP
jgi:hypothetical protein